jgi:hypothetical protein
MRVLCGDYLKVVSAVSVQSAMDRLQSAAYELVVEGDSYRQRQKPALGEPVNPAPPN